MNDTLLQRQIIVRETRNRASLGGSTIDFLSPCKRTEGERKNVTRKPRAVKERVKPRWMNSEVFSTKKHEPKIRTRKTTIHAQVDPFTDFERPVWMRSDRGSVSFEAKEEPFSSEKKQGNCSETRETNRDLLERLRNKRDETQYLSLNLNPKRKKVVARKHEEKLFQHSKRTQIEPVTLNQLKNDWDDRLKVKGLLAKTRQQRLMHLRESQTKLTSKIGARNRRKQNSSELKKLYKQSITQTDFVKQGYQTRTSKDYVHPRESNWHYERKSKHGRISGESTQYASSMSRAVDIGKIY